MTHSNQIDQYGHAYVAFPDYASLAALRAWYEGLSARAAVDRYLSHKRVQAQSSRGILGRIRRRLIYIAESNERDDLVAVFADRSTDRTRLRASIHRAIEALRKLDGREPQINDDIGCWLPKRANRALKSLGVTTLAELTLRVPRRQLWWTDIDGIGPASARGIVVPTQSVAPASKQASTEVVPVVFPGPTSASAPGGILTFSITPQDKGLRQPVTAMAHSEGEVQKHRKGRRKRNESRTC